MTTTGDDPQADVRPAQSATAHLTPAALAPAALTAAMPAGVGGLAGLRAAPVWSDQMVAAAGITAHDAPFVTVGGGLASFALVNFLRVCGAPTDEIRVVSPQRRPYENLHDLMRRSQILDQEPLRSESMARVDNIWGFPGYAMGDAVRRRSPGPMLRVLAEPLAAEYFNPSPDQVFGGVDREAARIGWDSMVLPARAQLLRRREEGGYFCLVCPVDGSAPVALRSQYAHLGTGYPGVRYVPEVSRYRIEHREYFNVVNAYEPHEHVYQVLRRRPGSVVVRGAGITASRVLQRLFDDRRAFGQDVTVTHLFRTYADRAQGPSTFRRPGGDGWNYQPFSFPKAAGSGQLRRRLFSMNAEQRAAFIGAMDAATTAKRRMWQRQLTRAREVGAYRALKGEIRAMSPAPDGKVDLTVDADALPAGATLQADFVIDCTGLTPTLRDSPLLADLLETGGARLNPLGGLDVGAHFDVRGGQQESGQLYASGVIARGGYLAPVDSFWGFTHAALLICDDLARRGFCGRLGLARSVTSWFKWLMNEAP
ncbi:MAG: hypothetical protein GEU94_11460 [Micromonosporaceae bacterium]|nr:hypothetical protein [Micromonosporaceae bacterium]